MNCYKILVILCKHSCGDDDGGRYIQTRFTISIYLFIIRLTVVTSLWVCNSLPARMPGFELTKLIKGLNSIELLNANLSN